MNPHLQRPLVVYRPVSSPAGLGARYDDAVRIGALIFLLVFSLPGRAQSESPGTVIEESLGVLRDKNAAPLDTLFAIWRLGHAGNFAHVAAPELIDLLGDERFSDAAAQTIHRLGAGKTEVFLGALKSKSEKVRLVAARELLTAKVNLAEIPDRRAFVEMIAAIDLEQSAAVLGAAAADPDPQTRELALQALAKTRDAELRWVVERIIEPRDADLAEVSSRFPDERMSDLALGAVRGWLHRHDAIVGRTPLPFETEEDIRAHAEHVSAILAAQRRREAEEYEEFKREEARRIEAERARLLGIAFQVLSTSTTEAGPRALEAAHAIAGIPADLVAAARRTLDQIEHGTVAQRREALARLALAPFLTGPVEQAVHRCLHDEDSTVRHRAAKLIGTPQAQAAARRGDLVDNLSSANDRTRGEAVEAMVREGMLRERDAKVVAQAIRSESWMMRSAFVTALSRAWIEERPMHQVLLDMDHEPASPIQRLAITAAGRMLIADQATAEVIEPQRRQLIEMARKGMSSPQPGDVLRSLHLLRQLGIDYHELRPQIEAAALSADRELRAEATVALVTLGEAGVPGLLAMLDTDDPAKRGLALVQLGSMGKLARAATGPIRKLCDDPDTGIAQLAAQALQQIEPYKPGPNRQRELEPLLTKLRDPSPEARKSAAFKLDQEQVLESPVASALIKSVARGDFAAREGMVLGIERAWKLQTSVEAALKEVAAKDDDAVKRAYAKAALRALQQ